jgi:Na+/phosphate symporter
MESTMKVKIFLMSAIISIACMSYAHTASAQDFSDNPYKDDIKAYAEKLAKSLSEEQVDDLSKLREVFGMVESIKLVRTRVAQAVWRCAKKHESLDGKINDRFKDWKKHINPTLGAKERQMKKAIEAKGRFDNPEEITGYFDLIKNAADHANKQVKREVVTTEEACNSLYESMESTKANIVDVLNSVEFPEEK